MIMRPCAQTGWKLGDWASTATPLSRLGQSTAFSVPICLTPTALSEPEPKGLHGHYKVFHPQRDPAGDTKRNRKPRTSQKSFPRQSGERHRTERRGWGWGQPMQEPGPLSRAEAHPRHTHLPAEAPQSALTGDACGHSRQRSHPRPEPQYPPALHLAASRQGVE